MAPVYGSKCLLLVPKLFSADLGKTIVKVCTQLQLTDMYLHVFTLPSRKVGKAEALSSC